MVISYEEKALKNIERLDELLSVESQKVRVAVAQVYATLAQSRDAELRAKLTAILYNYEGFKRKIYQNMTEDKGFIEKVDTGDALYTLESLMRDIKHALEETN